MDVPASVGRSLPPLGVVAAPKGPSYFYRAHVRDVIDGDTLVLDIDLGLQIVAAETHVRLYGLNAAEKDTAAGKRSKAYLMNYLPAGVVVQTIKVPSSLVERKEKYGRYLGIVWRDEVNVNQRLIDRGYAKSWDGKGPRPT